MIGLAALIAAQATSAVTPEEAQRLPMAVLARRVLGDAGALVVDVDRPAPPTCGGLLGPRCPDPPLAGPPPLSEGITFYNRPEAAVDLSSWRGLCTSTTLKAVYDERSAFSRLEVGARFSAPVGLRRELPPRDFGAWLRGENAVCAKAGPVKRFFYAGDGITAYRGLIGITLFEAAVTSNKSLTFRFTCSQTKFAVENCAKTVKKEEWRSILDFANVHEVQQESCSPSGELTLTGAHACYLIFLAADGEEVHLELDHATTEPRLLAFHYGNDMVVY